VTIGLKRLRLFLVGVVPLGLVFAGPPVVVAEDLSPLLAAIHAQADGLKTLVCRVHQERYLKLLSRPVRFTGRLMIEKPDRLRLEFTTPLVSVFLLDGSKGAHCSGEGEPHRFDLGADPAMGAMGRQMTSWMAGDYAALQKLYHMEAVEPGPGIILTPQDPGVVRVIRRITVLFEPDTYHPVRLEIVESGGDRTVLSFSDFVVNRPLDGVLFSQCDPT